MSQDLSDPDEVPSRKDLLDIESLSVAEIRYLLDTAKPFKNLFKKSVKKVPTLRGKSVLNLFYEPSTRTSSSFEVAETRLSADITNFTVSSSSVVKGESLLDTIDTLHAMRTDYIVIRHQAAGVPANGTFGIPTTRWPVCFSPPDSRLGSHPDRE